VSGVEDVVLQHEPLLGPGLMGGQAQDGPALWTDESSGHVDQLSSQGRAPGDRVGSGWRRARSRLWAIAAQIAQAEFATKLPAGRCAIGPSMTVEDYGLDDASVCQDR
jgi:hypothetical protein